MTVHIFTDGASRGNPGRGGWGAILVLRDEENQEARSKNQGKVKELGGREEHTTNNRMELRAVIEALVWVKHEGEKERVIVYTDSAYVIKGATSWIHGWQKNGWKTKEKKDVLNKDLWMELASAMENSAVEFENVSGHVGVKGNERADEIATSFADSAAIELFEGTFAEYSIDVFDLGEDTGKREAKESKGARSRAKAYSYVSLVDGEVKVHKTWAECEARVKGKRAKFKKAVNVEEERGLVREWGGV